jgi:hypothetical protein
MYEEKGDFLMYRLKTDGDSREMTYADKFLYGEFPAYEEFWQKYIIRLTNRPVDIHFKDAAALSAIGCGDQQIQVAQLHYSVLVHLAAAWDLRQGVAILHKELSWALFSLVSAQDVASELLARVLLGPNSYDAFHSTHSKKAREDWTHKNPWPADIASVRRYRNGLTHGHICPTEDRGAILFPSIGKESAYPDWRVVTANKHNPQDFETGKQIIDGAWKITLNYLQGEWENELLKHPVVQSLPVPSKPQSAVNVHVAYTAIASGQAHTSGTTKPYVIP